MIDVSSIDFVDLIDELGLKNARMTAGGVEVSYSCHGAEHATGDSSPSAYVNSETGACYCHGCKFSSNVVGLVMAAMQVSKATATRWLRERYGIEFDEPVGGSMVAETEARFRPVERPSAGSRPPKSWLSSTLVDWYDLEDPEPWKRYVIERGLSSDTLDEHQVGYDYVSDRITIPVFDLDGALFGFKGRAWRADHQPKYLNVGDALAAVDRGDLRYGFGTYPITDVVFGLHRAREYRRVVMVEGELDALALWQIGVPRPIATGTARMSECQRRLIVEEAEEVVVMYDLGAAGVSGTVQVVEALEPYVLVRVVEPLDVDPMDALRDGRQDEVLAAIQDARSSLAWRDIFV